MSEIHKIGEGTTIAKGNTKASNLIEDIKAKLGGNLMEDYSKTQEELEKMESENLDSLVDISKSQENINEENALKIEKYNKELLARVTLSSDKLIEVENKIKTKKEELQNLEIERMVLYGRYTSLLEFAKDAVRM